MQAASHWNHLGRRERGHAATLADACRVLRSQRGPTPWVVC